ncbi:MAG: 30S ribosomal protein S20 [Ignavibacteriae bacterium]|nr:30S ribosomal protein S20 [Ignavibacteriota bacterium]
MQRHKSAQKQARKAIRNQVRNRRDNSIMNTVVKRVTETKELDKAVTALNRAYKILDQLAAKGIIHKNKAARQKSQLKRLVSSLQPAAVAATPAA